MIADYLDTLSGAELERVARALAREMATCRHWRTHPGARQEDTDEWAASHWREFEDAAWDGLALLVSLRDTGMASVPSPG